MKIKALNLLLVRSLWLLALATCHLQLTTVHAQGTAFTYQGRLNNNGSPANGNYDLAFTLFSTNTGGAVIAGPMTNSATAVTNGLFTTLVDFGPGVFIGGSNWLELAVRTNGTGSSSGGGSFTTLAPRQPVTPTPYAITAGSANTLVGLAVQPNASSGAPNLIGGSPGNFVGIYLIGATIGGGGATNFGGYAYPNSVTGSFGTVGGGLNNVAGSQDTVGGGSGNMAGSQYGATVAGGQGNSAIGYRYSTVGGGQGNTASGLYAATVAGGQYNLAGGSYATVGGGAYNTNTGAYATIPGGAYNLAGGTYSFAAGQNAQATSEGAFVWADSQASTFSDNGSDSFNVRAQGGMFLDKSTPALTFGTFTSGSTRQMLNLYGLGYGIGVQNYTEYFRSGGGYAWYNGGSHTNTQNNPGMGGTTLMTLDSSGNVNIAGAFTGGGGGLTNIPASAVLTAPPGMALIPAGTFTMGNSIGDSDITDATPTNITVAAFYMDINLVSYSQWQSVYFWATNNGYGFVNAGAGKAANHPVQQVDWYDCVKWCNARSQQAGLTPVYYTDAGLTQVYTQREGAVTAHVNWSANGYRLPTEAEWEKAARGGLSGQRFPWGNVITENLANYDGDTDYNYDLGPNGYNTAFTNGVTPCTSPAGYFAPNGYGLYDMADDVTEWCWDWYGASYGQPTNTNPTGSETGSVRVVRGGSWFYVADAARCANRINCPPNYAGNVNGFRCVRGH